jgi:hypothetical protein
MKIFPLALLMVFPLTAQAMTVGELNQLCSAEGTMDQAEAAGTSLAIPEKNDLILKTGECTAFVVGVKVATVKLKPGLCIPKASEGNIKAAFLKWSSPVDHPERQGQPAEDGVIAVLDQKFRCGGR